MKLETSYFPENMELIDRVPERTKMLSGLPGSKNLNVFQIQATLNPFVRVAPLQKNVF